MYIKRTLLYEECPFAKLLNMRLIVDAVFAATKQNDCIFIILILMSVWLLCHTAFLFFQVGIKKID